MQGFVEALEAVCEGLASWLCIVIIYRHADNDRFLSLLLYAQLLLHPLVGVTLALMSAFLH